MASGNAQRLAVAGRAATAEAAAVCIDRAREREPALVGRRDGGLRAAAHHLRKRQVPPPATWPFPELCKAM